MNRQSTSLAARLPLGPTKERSRHPLQRRDMAAHASRVPQLRLQDSRGGFMGSRESVKYGGSARRGLKMIPSPAGTVFERAPLIEVARRGLASFTPPFAPDADRREDAVDGSLYSTARGSRHAGKAAREVRDEARVGRSVRRRRLRSDAILDAADCTLATSRPVMPSRGPSRTRRCRESRSGGRANNGAQAPHRRCRGKTVDPGLIASLSKWASRDGSGRLVAPRGRRHHRMPRRGSRAPEQPLIPVAPPTAYRMLAAPRRPARPECSHRLAGSTRMPHREQTRSHELPLRERPFTIDSLFSARAQDFRRREKEKRISRSALERLTNLLEGRGLCCPAAGASRTCPGGSCAGCHGPLPMT